MALRKRSSAGFTLTEIAIVLAIIGLILSAVWVAAKSVISSNRATQAAQDISTIVANLRSTFIAQNVFTSSGDQTAAMVTAGVIPNDLLITSATGSCTEGTCDAWNAPVKIYFAADGNTRHFRVSFYGTPPDACFRIASQIANLGTSDAPIDLITAAGGGTETIASVTGGANSACPNTTIGLCSNAINTVCSRNTSSGGTSSSTEFDFNIH